MVKLKSFIIRALTELPMGGAAVAGSVAQQITFARRWAGIFICKYAKLECSNTVEYGFLMRKVRFGTWTGSPLVCFSLF